METARALHPREDSSHAELSDDLPCRIAREIIPCDGCGDCEPSRIREFEIHIVRELYVQYWLCDGCLEAVGLGRMDPPAFCGFLTGYERIGLELREPAD